MCSLAVVVGRKATKQSSAPQRICRGNNSSNAPGATIRTDTTAGHALWMRLNQVRLFRHDSVWRVCEGCATGKASLSGDGGASLLSEGRKRKDLSQTDLLSQRIMKVAV